MPTVHLIEGPVGAGKSTFARSLSLRLQGVHIPLDEWFARVFSPDRPAADVMPWYVARKERLLALIWHHAQGILATGTDVILELGLIQRQGRLAFCEQVAAQGHDLMVHIVDAPRDVRRLRVQRRNTERGPTFSMVVPDHVFEMASDLWEPPDDVECDMFAVEFVAESLR